MQTAVNAAGLAAFEGDLDRFAIFSLIVAQTHPDAPASRPIAANSLAMSIDRPFETVRRHVNGLIAAGLCMRIGGRIGVVPDRLAEPALAQACSVAHDGFVHFVEQIAAAGLMPPLPSPTRAYHAMTGVAAAVDVMFAAVTNNRLIHRDWLSLTIFSAVLLANAERYAALAPLGGVPLAPMHAVRASVIARALHLPETTVRRRLVHLTAAGGPLLRCAQGLFASREWLANPSAAATSAATYAAIRLILTRAAANGFPFHDPASAYLVGPPPPCFA